MVAPRTAALSASVLVVGAGALGNEVMKNLALLGLGTIYLIDLDNIELSNLSRSVLFRETDGGRSKAVVAALRSRELNPDLTVIPIHGDVMADVGLGLFADVDLVFGCLDNREARLWVNRQCWKTSTPWIDAGIQEIQGVVKVFVPPDSACYECAMTERDYQLLNRRYSCPLLSRDELLSGKVPTAPTIASMMAALQVQESLKLLHGMEVAAGSAHVYNGVANQFYTTKLPVRKRLFEPRDLSGGGRARARAQGSGVRAFRGGRAPSSRPASSRTGSRAGGGDRMPAVRVAQRSDAAAGEGEIGRGPMPELPRAGAALV